MIIITKIKDIYNMFTNIWKLYRKYNDCLNTDENIEAMQAEVRETYEKYNTQFCRDLLHCLVEEFDRLEKAAGKE